MQRIQARGTGNTSLALTTIYWLFFARRPLCRQELLHALALSGRNPQAGKNLPAVSHVLDSCAGLVVMDGTHSTIGFFHKTFDDFLVKNHSIWFPRGEELIGTICVKYLSLDAFADGPVSRPNSDSKVVDYTLRNRRLDQFPLYTYASEYWHDHVRGTDLETADIVMIFLAHANKLAASLEGKEYLPRTTGAYVAVRCSLSNALERHLKLCSSQINARDSFERTPLSWAAHINDLVAADHLVKAGADPNVQDYDCDESNYSFNGQGTRNPLSYAAMQGHLQMVEFLLNMGACDNEDAFSRSALLHAVRHDEEAVVKLLLQRGSAVDSQDLGGRTLLSHAVCPGSESFELVSALLDHGANVNQADYKNTAPISYAAKAGRAEFVSLLIARGAEVNLDDRYGTPLCAAGLSSSVDAVGLLLQAGAAANYIDKTSRSVLSYAIEGGSTECVELLLEKGADINRPNPELSFCEQIYYAVGMTRYNKRDGGFNFQYPGLTMSLMFDHTEPMLKFVLSRGANPNRLVATRESTVRLGSPLCYALEHMRIGDPKTTRMIEMLLRHGARVDEEHDRKTVLASTKRHGNDVRSLLHQYGVIKDDEGVPS
jgi:ankyrin repeat protein